MRLLLSQARRRLLTPPMIIALVALFFAVGGPAAADTGGNWILGSPNLASSTTSLKASASGTAGLDVSNTGTAAGSFPLSLEASPGIAPFQTNSATKVTNLNADKLDGINSTAFQKGITGSCGIGAAIDQINTDGSVDCRRAPNLLVGGSVAGPLPRGHLGVIETQEENTLLVQFTATAFRPAATGAGPIGITFYLCTTSPDPCDASNEVAEIHQTAWASKANFHLPISAVATWILVPAGDYNTGLGLDPGTSSNANDDIAYDIISFQP